MFLHVLKALKNKAGDGPVTFAIDEIQTYLNKQAHRIGGANYEPNINQHFSYGSDLHRSATHQLFRHSIDSMA